MTTLSRFKSVVVLLLSGVALYVGLVNLLERMEWKNPSDGIRWVEESGQLRVAGFQTPLLLPDGVSLSKGDRLLAINGVPIHSLDDHTEVLDLLAASLPEDSPVGYRFQKAGGGPFEVPLRIARQAEAGSIDLLLALVAFIHLGVGLLVFLRHWRAPGAFHFYLVCLFAFVLYLYRHSGRADLFDIVVYWCSLTALLILPPLFLHFCCHFPRRLTVLEEAPRLVGLFYLPAFSLLGLHVLWFSGRMEAIGFPRTLALQQWLDRVHLTHFLLFFLGGALILQFSRRESRSEVQRLQLKWIGRGTLIGILPFLLFYTFPFLLGLKITPLMQSSVLGMAFIPLSFGYAISRYRLTDIELIFKQGAAYVLASSALLALYVGLVLLIGRALHGFSPQSGFTLFALSALLVAFLFAPLRDRIQEQINRYFYREEYDYRQSLADFAGTLSSEIRLEALVKSITQRIGRTLNVSPVAVFLRQESDSDRYRLYYAPGLESSDGTVSIPEALFRDFDRRLNPLFLLAPDEEVEEIQRVLARWRIEYVQPLRVHARVIGFLGLGRRNNGDLLSSEDLELLATAAGYTAIAVDNALLYQSLESKAGELVELKVYNENVVESISVGVVAITPEGIITVWNNSAQDICGRKRAAVLGRNIEEVFPLDLIRSMRQVMEGPRWVVDRTAHLYKMPYPREGGKTRLLNLTLSPFVMKDDVVTGTLIALDDITEKVQLENQLSQAEKLSSIGLFAAGVAHEVNTPLAGISSYAQILLKGLSPEDSRYPILKKIEAQSFRASEIMNNLLNFARVEKSQLEEVNINSLMVETLSLLDHQLEKNHITIELELDPSLPGTLASGGKLQQVFMNLFLNARDAMPEGGKLTIATGREESALVVEVRDTGVGISREDMKRIYDPFFTTKDVGKGTGLGLSVSYGIIREHAGRISVESEPGRGTTFRLHLPIRRVN